MAQLKSSLKFVLFAGLASVSSSVLAEVPDTKAAAIDHFKAAYPDFCAPYDELLDFTGDDKYLPNAISITYQPYEDADDTTLNIYEFLCTRGAYNFGMIYLKHEFGAFSPVSFAEPVLDITYENPDDTFESKVTGVKLKSYRASTVLINAGYDARTKTITSFSKWRGIGDAYSAGTWVFKDGHFLLKSYEVDASYDGKSEPQFKLSNEID